MAESAEPLDDLLGSLPDAEAFAAALDRPFRRAIRVHPLRGVPQGWEATEAIPWWPGGLWHAGGDPDGHLDRQTGCAWPQDAASMAPVALLDPQPGEVIADVCAAPGSKSTQIANAIGDAGLLLCADADPARRRLLVESLARQGAACALVTPLPLQGLAAMAPASCDGVLADVPCSGHRPVAARQARRMGERQLNILLLAARLLRPGGRLVYSTCTPWRVEDEQVIEAFLARLPDWRVEAAALPGCDPDLHGLGGLRLWPQRQGCEPFFACRLRAPGDDVARPPLGQAPAEAGLAAAWLASCPLRTWTAGALAFAAGPLAASCALPAQARGLLLGRSGPEGLDLQPWAAQALIGRGAAAERLPHALACRLWAGESASLPPGGLLATEHGAPLGRADRRGERLDLPSRLRRAGLR